MPRRVAYALPHKLQYALALSENNNQRPLGQEERETERLRHTVSTNLMEFALLLQLQLICSVAAPRCQFRLIH